MSGLDRVRSRRSQVTLTDHTGREYSGGERERREKRRERVEGINK